jgi:hypothetical protein
MSKIKLDDIQKRQVFMKLSQKSYLDVGMEFGFDKYYPNKLALRQAVRRIFEEVSKDPEKFSIGKDALELVKTNIYDRYQNPIPQKISMAGGEEIDLAKLDEKELVLRGKKVAWLLLNKKMNMAVKNSKELGKVSLGTLASVAGIVFDKAQIVRGEATENIALRAKIDENISPTDALSEILKRRENND